MTDSTHKRRFEAFKQSLNEKVASTENYIDLMYVDLKNDIESEDATHFLERRTDEIVKEERKRYLLRHFKNIADARRSSFDGSKHIEIIDGEEVVDESAYYYALSFHVYVGLDEHVRGRTDEVLKSRTSQYGIRDHIETAKDEGSKEAIREMKYCMDYLPMTNVK